MAAKLLLILDAPDDVLSPDAYDTGAVIALQRSTSSAFGTPADVDRIAVVAGTYAYTYWDADGTSLSWYRWRLENAGATETGEWSDAFQGWDPATGQRRSGAYATPDRLQMRTISRPGERATDRLARYELALLEGRERIDDALGVQGLFFRSPQEGADEARVYDPDGCVVHVHNGIVELTGIRIKRSPSSSWETVDVDDARLEYWADTGAAHTLPDGEPYDHVVLTGAGSLLQFPGGRASVELTGAFGWPRIPRRGSNANIEWARQALSADASFSGGQTGNQELGRPVGYNRMPDAVYRLVMSFSRRFWCQL